MNALDSDCRVATPRAGAWPDAQGVGRTTGLEEPELDDLGGNRRSWIDRRRQIGTCVIIPRRAEQATGRHGVAVDRSWPSGTRAGAKPRAATWQCQRCLAAADWLTRLRAAERSRALRVGGHPKMCTCRVAISMTNRLEAGIVPVVPALVVAQVSRSAAQVQLRRLQRGCGVSGTDGEVAHAAGYLLGRASTSDVSMRSWRTRRPGCTLTWCTATTPTSPASWTPQVSTYTSSTSGTAAAIRALTCGGAG